jgi:hypothetical protein
LHAEVGTQALETLPQPTRSYRASRGIRSCTGTSGPVRRQRRSRCGPSRRFIIRMRLSQAPRKLSTWPRARK